MPTLEENRSKKCTLATPERILVATDLRDTDYVVPYAIAQAKACGAQVTLVHALPPSDVVPMDGAMIRYVDKTKIVGDVRVMLSGVARQFESQGVSCDTAVRDGIARNVIPEELSRTDATRLIMGTHGRGKLGQLILGSVAHDLITETNVPVFVVGPHARDSVHHATPRKILHPVSLMGDYRECFHLALAIAQSYGAELILLHILDQHLNASMDPARTIAWANRALNALIPDGTEPAPPILTTVTSGKVAEEILKAAAQTGADWIVLGAEGRAPFWSFDQSAAYKVLIAADCPVLTLRHEPSRTEAAVNFKEVHFTSPL
jgi:nucleotide-binding universal stress UspA family protein